MILKQPAQLKCRRTAVERPSEWRDGGGVVGGVRGAGEKAHRGSANTPNIAVSCFHGMV